MMNAEQMIKEAMEEINRMLKEMQERIDIQNKLLHSK